MRPDWQINLTSWSKLNDQKAMKLIRNNVFIIEQSVPEELEWDELDDQCLHCLVNHSDGTPVATARLHYENNIAHIGRMAVLKDYRHLGAGTLMLKTFLEHAQTIGVKQVAINAQTVAMNFYNRLGFTAIGDEFDDAGIPHFKMLLNIGENND